MLRIILSRTYDPSARQATTPHPMLQLVRSGGYLASASPGVTLSLFVVGVHKFGPAATIRLLRSLTLNLY